jgi:DNA-binding transcriptional regulator YiaG
MGAVGLSRLCAVARPRWFPLIGGGFTLSGTRANVISAMGDLDRLKTIRPRREALGLTQQELATRAGISYAMLRLLDTGRYQPRHYSEAGEQVLEALHKAEEEAAA